MTQEQNKPVNLAVHESVDPSLFNPAQDQEADADINDLNDSRHDDENVDVPTPGLSDGDDKKPGDSQVSIANIGGAS